MPAVTSQLPMSRLLSATAIRFLALYGHISKGVDAAIEAPSFKAMTASTILQHVTSIADSSTMFYNCSISPSMPLALLQP